MDGIIDDAIITLKLLGDSADYPCRFEFNYRPEIPAKLSGNPDSRYLGTPEEIEIIAVDIQVDDDIWVNIPPEKVNNQLEPIAREHIHASA